MSSINRPANRSERLTVSAFPRPANLLPDSPLVLPILVILTLAGAVGVGWSAVTLGMFKTAALLLAAGALVILISDVRAGLWSVLAVATLLPFAVVPVRLGLTLTLLEAALLVTLGVWLLCLMLRRNERLRAGPAALGVIALLAVTLFAFLLGVGRGYTTQTFHDYFKFVLAIVLFFAVWNAARTSDDVKRLVVVLVIGATSAATLGLALYAAGAAVTLNALARLIPYGYPSGRIVRYIEDDPTKPMRMVSTSVDPNSFGGLLAVALVLAVTQVVARYPIVPRWLSGASAGVLGMAMLLTFSRGAWVAAAVGLALITVLRYRWLAAPGVLAGIAALVFGLGATFLQRMWLGLTLQDPATKLRLAEYRNALEIIREHPVFGVGFGDAPSIDLQAGVSSIYLTIAERMGLVGLAVFLGAVGIIWLAGFRAWSQNADSVSGDLMLGLLAALTAALAVGVLDHYYFNITFPHMAALFWTVCGLIMALRDAKQPMLRVPRSE